MGIVAYCPQGHRVKVKDQLAGKKGLCPICGTKFRIPVPDAAPQAGAAVIEPGAVPPDAVAGGDRTGLPWARMLSLDAAIVVTLPRATAWDATAVVGPHAAEATAAPPDPPAAHPPVAHAPAAPPRRPLHPLIAEREDLAWSIAYPGGEPSAPLPAEAMQDWLDTRQATGDEVVWRADWPQWLPVRQVFPECFG